MSASGVWLFPGQGGQRAGMLHVLADSSPAADVFETTAAVLGQDALALDSEESLSTTRGTQVALLLAGVIAARDVLHRGVEPAWLAGHSLGAWTAAVVTGTLALDDAIRLVDLRGRRMAEVNPCGYGMAAITGLPVQQVIRLVDAVRATGEQVWASNRNAPDQTVVSGSPQALAAVVASARDAGATKAVVLRVAVAAHSPLMQPVADELAAELARISLQRPRWPVAGNATGRTLRTAAQVADDLAASTSAPVMWDTATSVLMERGAQYWLQMPPGHALASMVSRQWPHASVLTLGETSPAEACARISRY